MASVPRIYVGSDNIENGYATVCGSDAKHVLLVMRKKVGDTVCICDMHGMSYNAVIRSAGDGFFTVELGEGIKRVSEIGFPVKVYQCMPKGDKLDTVVQKAVELGASEIIAVMSERCVSRPDGKAFEKRLERLGRISESAAAQCGREFVPAVRGIISYREAIDEMKESGTAFVCYEGDGTVSLQTLLREKFPQGVEEDALPTVSIVIGSEGGFSLKEAQRAREAGMICVGLGPRILRTETASSFVLSALVYELEL